MSIPSSLAQKIYVAYALGSNSENKMEYSDPIEVYAQVSDVKSVIVREDVGAMANYDRILVVPQGDNSQYIDESTLLWLNIEPNAAKTNMDFKIERVGDVIDGNTIIYCSSLSSNSKPLYYEYNGKIYKTNVDIDNLVAIIPNNKFLPINKNSNIWLTKPVDSSSTKNKIVLVSEEAIGKSRKFTFRKAQNDFNK